MTTTTSRIPLTFLALLLMAGLAAPEVLAARDIHLRVEVTDPRTGEEKVRLNMPLTSVDALMEVLEDEMQAEFGLRTHGEEFLTIKKIYHAIRDEDLSDFLEMTGEDGEWVKVWKDREAFRVEARDEHGVEVANLYLPLVVLDVLFAGDDEPNLRGALKQLRSLAPLTILTVDDESKQVRVWLE